MFNACPRSVNKFLTDHFFEMLGDFDPKWSPYVAKASLGRVYVAPPWHHGTIAPRALNNKKENGENAPK